MHDSLPFLEDRPSVDLAYKVTSDIDAMLGYWDRDLRCRFANPAYHRWFGIHPRELIGLPLQELLGPIYELNAPHVRAALLGQTQVFERAIPMKDGSLRYALASYHPDIRNGILQGFTAHVTDVTRMKLLEFELQTARAEAERMATHDHLTGLPNRVKLIDRINRAIRCADETGGLAGVVAIDFDEFKQINDSYGHDTGDYVLREVANRMRATLRSTDTVTRIGGDEFIFLASALESRIHLELAIERLRQSVCQPVLYQKALIFPRFSTGVAIYPFHGKSAFDLLNAADIALYEAKNSIKGGVVCSPID